MATTKKPAPRRPAQRAAASRPIPPSAYKTIPVTRASPPARGPDGDVQIAEEIHAATFTKLKDGTWGLRLDEREVTYEGGEVVQVTRKDGTVDEVTVGKILWRGISKITGAEIALATREAKTPDAPAKGDHLPF